MKRREFLNTSVIAGTAALVAPSAVLATPAITSTATRAAAGAQSYARKFFAARLHQQFEIETSRGVIAAELVTINEACACKGLDQFTPVFRVPHNSDVVGLQTLVHGADRFPMMIDRAQDDGHS